MSNLIKSFRVVEEEYDNEVKDYYEENSKLSEKKINKTEDIKKILENAQNKSNKIISDAKKQANNIIVKSKIDSNDIIVKAKNKGIIEKENAKKAGYDSGYKEGYNKGYEIGYNEGKIESDKLISEALNLKEQYIEMQKKLPKKLETEIIEMVIQIYEKVIGNRLETDDEYILDLVHEGIKNLDPTEKLTIIVSKGDYGSVLENKDKILAKASLINDLEVKYDINLEKGDCILETPKGNIDLSIKDQIEEINDTLNKVLSNE